MGNHNTYEANVIAICDQVHTAKNIGLIQHKLGCFSCSLVSSRSLA